jgi:co-chaperonin GroES (HSP10)
MAKSYLMGDGESLTDEQKASVARAQQENDSALKKLSEEQREKAKEKKMVTLHQLFNTKIDPREDRVVIFPDPVDEFTESGLLKPDEVIKKEQQRPMFGTVVAVGPGLKVEQTVTNRLLLLLCEAAEVPDLEQIKKECEEQISKLEVGQRVMFGRMAGTPIDDPDTKTQLLILRPNDIFARLK